MKMPRRVTPLRSGLAFVELGKSFQPDSACLLPAEFGHQSTTSETGGVRNRSLVVEAAGLKSRDV